MSIAEFLSPQDWLEANNGPRYLQLQRHLQSAISDGTLKAGTALPPEREIAVLTGLSRVTVRRAVAPLVSAGMIIQKHGSGSVISPINTKVEQSLSRLTSFTEDISRRGITVSSKTLVAGLFLPTPEEIMTLALGATSKVARLERLRYGDNFPLAIERAALAEEHLPKPTAVKDSLYKTLSENGCQPVRAIQRITATNLNSEDASLLDVETHTAGLEIVRVSYLESGQAIELTKSVYRGDAYDFVAELKIPQVT